MNFSDWLQDQILKTGKTRKEVAKLAGIPKRRMDEFCNGMCPSSFESKKLSKALTIGFNEIEDMISGNNKLNLAPVKGYFKSDFSQTAPNQIKSDYKTPLQPVKVNTCVLTGKPNPERCHYTGIMQHLFSKGMSEKCDHLFVAEICREKHIEFDQPKERKSLQASHDFIVAILLTIKRKAENGQIIFVK